MADEPQPAKGDDGKPEGKPDNTTTTDPAKADPVVAQAEHPDAVKRALDAERAAVKEAKKRADAAEAKVREFEDRDKSELEKLTGKVTKAEQAKAEADAKLLRFEVAAEKKIPADAVELLIGNTREELEAKADKLLALAKSGEKSPDFDGGTREPAPETKTPEQAHGELIRTALGLSRST